MKKLSLLLALMSLIALFAGCRKEEPWPLSALPPATTTGENTAGCGKSMFYSDREAMTALCAAELPLGRYTM